MLLQGFFVVHTYIYIHIYKYICIYLTIYVYSSVRNNTKQTASSKRILVFRFLLPLLLLFTLLVFHPTPHPITFVKHFSQSYFHSEHLSLFKLRAWKHPFPHFFLYTITFSHSLSLVSREMSQIASENIKRRRKKKK